MKTNQVFAQTALKNNQRLLENCSAPHMWMSFSEIWKDAFLPEGNGSLHGWLLVWGN